ncbi:MAG: GNAT family N-acetyltransferase [Cyanobacteria bacterium P01_A01_bin.114]
MSSRQDAITWSVPGYRLRQGSDLDHLKLLDCMQCAYRELGATRFDQLEATVRQTLSEATQLWWVESDDAPARPRVGFVNAVPGSVGCLWLGSAIDQSTGQRQAYVFLVYIAPEHRRRGLGTALMQYGQSWAQRQGYQQVGLQVFERNQSALNLYQKLGYQPQAIWMVKELN